MVQASQLSSGMTISVSGHVYRVESAMKVSVAKGAAFIKAKLKDLGTGALLEKNFKPTQEINETVLQEARLEFLYPEEDSFVFLNIATLDQVPVPADIIGKKKNYLKEGVEVKASAYGSTVLGIELPQFLELSVAAIEGEKNPSNNSDKGARIARLETGASVEVPPFIQVGDVLKVDTQSDEYIQRV